MDLLRPIRVLMKLWFQLSFNVLDHFEGLLDTKTFDSRDDCRPKRGASPDSSPESSEKDIKRIKLILDISLSPGGSRILNVSTTNVTDGQPESKLLPKKFAVSRVRLELLEAVKALKHLLTRLNAYLLPADKSLKISSPLHSRTRRMKSPKRRIPHYKRILCEFPFAMLGLKVTPTECLITLPNNKEESNKTLCTRTKCTEKRKHSDGEGRSEGSGSECSLTPERRTRTSSSGDRRSPMTLDLPVIVEAQNDEEVTTLLSPDDPLAYGSCQSCESGSGSSTDQDNLQEQYQPIPSLTQRLLDIEEENYDSAEDPDYTPNLAETSTSSDDSFSQDPLNESEIEKELTDLAADAKEELPKQTAVDNFVSETPTTTVEHQTDVENGNVQDQFGESHHTNPLLARHRRFYGTETETSSPWSMQPSEPSEPSIPNTPRTFNDSFQSHPDSP